MLKFSSKGLALCLFLVSIAFYSNAQNSITIAIQTDCWGGEISFNFQDSEGNVLAEAAGNTLASQTLHTYPLDLADGCYTFTINDSYGDGLNGAAYESCGEDGNWQILDSDGNELAAMLVADFDNEDSIVIGLPEGAVPGCTNPIATNYDACASSDDGSCLYDPLTAEISYEQSGPCAGSSATFSFLSEGLVENFAWTMAGSDTNTSTDENPTATYPAAGDFDVTLTVSNTLGESFTATETVSFVVGNTLEVVIVQDNYPQETSWTLVDASQNLLGSGGAESASICVPDECLTFTIFDSFGDGICCGYGEGSYSLILNGTELATGGQFSTEDQVSINCPPGFDCNNAIEAAIGLNTAGVPNEWFTFIPDTTGQWKITTCDLASCNTKLWLYDYCDMSNFDDSNEATITYNDDLCGEQAELTPLLEKDEVYYIRVGDTDDACGSNPIDFEISFLGGITGCQDEFACNYSPLAVTPAACFYNDDPECTDLGPDLWLLEDVLYESMYLTSLDNNDACLVAEGCLQGFGDREIIRFTTHIKNIGNQDYFIGQPSEDSDQFEFDDCHGHWHYEGYAEYLLYDAEGAPMDQIGFKNGFCVLDLECSDGGQAKYTCGNMGITAGCGDIYGSSLACQWIDITDLDAGSYTFVARTNWDQAPDAVGRFELRYDNNWAQTCISFERDVDGNAINFTKSQDNCPLVVDCLGQPFGNAQADCAGNCPGQVVKGDINNSLEIELADAQQYVLDIMGNDGVATPCTDMDNDGLITVTDAALLANCALYGETHNDPDEGLGVHSHCIWNDPITNINHLTTLSIGEINTEEEYVDIYVLNPDNEIVGYEFEISGFEILSAENLVNPADYDIQPSSTLGGNKVLGLSMSDMVVPKHLSPAPLVRLYYSSLSSTMLCVETIVDVVNEDYHNVLTATGECIGVAQGDFADFEADMTTVCQGESVSFTNTSLGDNTYQWNFEGGSPSSSTAENPVISYLVPGVYTVTLTADDGATSDSETKTGYITVLASQTYYADVDLDGFGDPENAVEDCTAPLGFVTDNTDCDDSNFDVYPGAEGTGQGIDNNCNGTLDPDELSPNGSCLGDLDGNGIVSTPDLVMLIGEFGCNTSCVADMDDNGNVGTSDLLLLLNQMGVICG